MIASLRTERIEEPEERVVREELRRACDASVEYACESLRARAAILDAEAACRRGRAAECRLAGQGHEDGLRLPRDATRAAELWERGCAGGDGLSCHHLFELGRSRERAVRLSDPAAFARRALPALEAACRRAARARSEDDARLARRACVTAAEIRWTGLGVSRDPRGAVRILGSAGEDGLSALANLYTAAPDEPTAAAVERALLALERRTPDIDDHAMRPSAMARLARLAREDDRVACEAGSPSACVRHAQSEPFGALIVARLDALCAEGNGVACVTRAVEVSETLSRAAPDLERQRHYTSAADAACRAGQAAACIELARFYRQGEYADVPRSDRLFDAAVEHVRAGCRAGVAPTCEVASWLSIGQGERRRELAPDDRRPLLARACELGVRDACDPALRLVRDLPEGAERDALHLRLARRGCSLGVFGPCRDVVSALERGAVPEAERAAVTAELAAHCRAGIEGTCPDD